MNISASKLDLQSSKNKNIKTLTNALKSTAVEVVMTTGIGIAMNALSAQAGKLSSLVTKTNKLVDKANLTQTNNDKSIARTSINSALKSINDMEAKIAKIKQKLKVVSVLITISELLIVATQLAIEFIMAQPAPIKPGTTILHNKLNKLKALVFALNVLVNTVVPPILTGIVIYLEIEKKKLKSLIDNSSLFATKTNNSGSLIAANTSNNEEDQLFVGGLIVDDNTTDPSSEVILGPIPNLNYKGYTFVIKANQDPKTIIGIHKQHYAQAVAPNGNIVLVSEYSYTTDVEVLIDELRTQIDRVSLV